MSDYDFEDRSLEATTPDRELTLREKIDILTDDDITHVDRLRRLGYDEDFFRDHGGSEFAETLVDWLYQDCMEAYEEETKAGDGVGRRALPNVYVSSGPDDAQLSMA